MSLRNKCLYLHPPFIAWKRDNRFTPKNVQFQKISIPTPWKVIGNSEEVGGGGGGISKAKGKYGAEGGGG